MHSVLLADPGNVSDTRILSAKLDLGSTPRSADFYLRGGGAFPQLPALQLSY